MPPVPTDGVRDEDDAPLLRCALPLGALGALRSVRLPLAAAADPGCLTEDAVTELRWLLLTPEPLAADADTEILTEDAEPELRWLHLPVPEPDLARAHP